MASIARTKSNNVQEAQEDASADAPATPRLARRAALGVLGSAAVVLVPRAAGAAEARDASDSSNASTLRVSSADLKADGLSASRKTKRTVLVLGATGRVGAASTLALLREGHDVRALVRDASRFAEMLSPELSRFVEKGALVPIVGDVSQMSTTQCADAMAGCHAVISALGHRVSREGLFGEPRFLVRDAAELVFRAAETLEAVEDAGDDDAMTFAEDTETSVAAAVAAREAARARAARARPRRFIALASAGADAPGGGDPARSLPERALMFALEKTLPPYADTLAQVRFVSERENGAVLAWTVLRPDDFVDVGDAPSTTPWTLYSTLQNGLFDAGTSSVVNIGDAMATLATCDDAKYAPWAGKMPQMLDDERRRR